jgi:hypothetical protein
MQKKVFVRLCKKKVVYDAKKGMQKGICKNKGMQKMAWKRYTEKGMHYIVEKVSKKE